MLGKFKGKALAVVLVTVMLSISLSPMIFNNQMGTQPQSSQSGNYPSTIFGSLQQYAQEQGTTVEELTANWTANDWLRWYKYEGNPSWGSTNITDQFLATDWVKLPNSGNLTWGANYDYEYKYNATSDQLEMWHNGTLVSYLGSDDLWHYASDRPNLTDLHHIVDREYVDHAVTSLGARYYMVGTSSGISDYKLTQLSPPSGSEDSVTKSSLADDDYIAGWIAPNPNQPSKLIKGVYNWDIYAEKTGGTKTLRLYWQLVERKSDTTETVIATSAVSNEISTSEGSYIIPLTLSEDYTLADGSYVVGKLYADVSGGGSAPGVAIYYDGASKSHWEIPTNLEIFSDQFLKLDGSNANSDIDITPYNLTIGNISAFNLKSLASHIIWKDGSTIYAMNGTTGLIDYSGTDASGIIQDVLDNTSGTVYMKNGLYLLNKAIEIKNNGTILIGEGENTILKRADVVESALSSDASSGQKNVVVSDASSFMVGQQVFIGQKSSTDNTWEINRIASISGNTLTMEFNLANSYTVADEDVVYTAYHIIEAFSKSNIAIKNLYIDGNKANNYYYSQYDTSITADYYENDGTLNTATFLVQNGIHLEKCSHSLVEGIHVKNNIGWGGVTLHKTTDTVVENCWTEYGIRHGIIVNEHAYRNLIHSCYSNNNGDTGETFPRHNYIIENNCRGTSITNCIGTNPSNNNVYIYETNYNTISGNFFSTDNTTYYVHMAGACKYIDVSDNIFYSYGSNTNLGRVSTSDACDYLTFSNNLFYTPATDTNANHLIMLADHSIINGNMFFNGNWAIYLAGVTDVIVSNNIFYDCDVGIEARTSGDDTVDRCLIIGNYIYNPTTYGIFFYNGGNDNAITNNYIYGSSEYAIYTGPISTNHGSISNNHIISCTHGIATMTSDVVIKDNILRDVSGSIIYNGGNAVIKNNIGYTTENSGTSEITGDGTNTSFNISHGLATTPTWVDITPTNESMASAMANGWFWNESATTSSVFAITFITAPANGDKLSFTWYAEV